jgi:nucleotide-binding universal stress UspA family protein
LLAGQPVLVVVVREAGAALAGLDAGTAFEVDQAMYHEARRSAAAAVEVAREIGLAARGLVVPADASVAETLVRLAREHDSPAVVVGAPNRGRVGELLLGSTARSLLHRAPCPVVVVREQTIDDRGD